MIIAGYMVVLWKIEYVFLLFILFTLKNSFEKHPLKSLRFKVDLKIDNNAEEFIRIGFA